MSCVCREMGLISSCLVCCIRMGKNMGVGLRECHPILSCSSMSSDIRFRHFTPAFFLCSSHRLTSLCGFKGNSDTLLLLGRLAGVIVLPTGLCGK